MDISRFYSGKGFVVNNTRTIAPSEIFGLLADRWNFNLISYGKKGNKRYYISNVLDMSGSEFLSNIHMIQSLFPISPITKNEIATILIFKDNVTKLFFKVLNFIGYEYTSTDRGGNLVINKGKFFNSDDTEKVVLMTRMMIFFNKIGMTDLSLVIYSIMCNMRSVQFRIKLPSSYNELNIWAEIERKNMNYQGNEGYNCTIKGLDYTGNSCYLDAVFVALFGAKSQFIDFQILRKDIGRIKEKERLEFRCSDNREADINLKKQLQNTIINIVSNMRNPQVAATCSNIRDVMKHCGFFPRGGVSGTQEASEFIMFLFKIFNIRDTIRISISKRNRLEIGIEEGGEVTPLPNRFDWIFVDRNENTEGTPIVHIDTKNLKNRLHTIDEFINQTYQTELDENNMWRVPGKISGKIRLYRQKLTEYSLIASHIIIFSANRLYRTSRGKTVFYNIEIIPLEYLQIGDKMLMLTAIVIYQGVHYTTVFKCDGLWFYYDDNPGSKHHRIDMIGSFEKMLKYKPSPTRQGTLYFYT